MPILLSKMMRIHRFIVFFSLLQFSVCSAQSNDSSIELDSIWYSPIPCDWVANKELTPIVSFDGKLSRLSLNGMKSSRFVADYKVCFENDNGKRLLPINKDCNEVSSFTIINGLMEGLDHSLYEQSVITYEFDVSREQFLKGRIIVSSGNKSYILSAHKMNISRPRIAGLELLDRSLRFRFYSKHADWNVYVEINLGKSNTAKIEVTPGDFQSRRATKSDPKVKATLTSRAPKYQVEKLEFAKDVLSDYTSRTIRIVLDKTRVFQRMKSGSLAIVVDGKQYVIPFYFATPKE